MWQHDPDLRPTFDECVHRLETQGARRQASVKRFKEGDHSPSSVVTRVVFENRDGVLLCVAYNAAEIWLGCSNGDVRVFSAKTTEQLWVDRHDSYGSKVLCVFSSAPTQGFSGSSDGTVRYWEGGAAPRSPRASLGLFKKFSASQAQGLSRSSAIDVTSRAEQKPQSHTRSSGRSADVGLTRSSAGDVTSAAFPGIPLRSEADFPKSPHAASDVASAAFPGIPLHSAADPPKSLRAQGLSRSSAIDVTSRAEQKPQSLSHASGQSARAGLSRSSASPTSHATAEATRSLSRSSTGDTRSARTGLPRSSANDASSVAFLGIPLRVEADPPKSLRMSLGQGLSRSCASDVTSLADPAEESLSRSSATDVPVSSGTSSRRQLKVIV
jgi:hypothetical protein